MGNDASSDNGGGNNSGWAGAPYSLPDTNTNSSNDNGGGNDSSSSNDNNSRFHSDNNCSSRCGWINGEFTKKDPNDSILCVSVTPNYSSSSSSSNDNNSRFHSDNNCSSRCVYTSKNGGYAIKDNGDRILCVRITPNYSSSSSNSSSNSTPNSVEREGANDGRNSNSFSSFSSNSNTSSSLSSISNKENEDQQRREEERKEKENNLYLEEMRQKSKIGEEKAKKEYEERLQKYKKNIKDGEAKEFEKEFVELHEVKVLYDSEKISWSEYFDKCRNIRNRYRINCDLNARFHMVFKLKDLNHEGKITHENYIKFRELIEYGNYLKSKKNIKDGKFAEYEKEFVEHHELNVLYNSDKISQVEYYEKRKNIDDKYKDKICQSEYYKETIIYNKTKENIDKYLKMTHESLNQYNTGKMTLSEYLKFNNNVKEVYEKYGHLNFTSVQFSNQVYFKIVEDASNQYKEGKIKPDEFVKICNDTRTKYYTEPVKPSTPAPTQPNSTLNNIGNGYVASAQARVNAVNLASSAVSNTAQTIVNGAVSVGNELISINNDTVLRQMETDRLRNEASQQLISNVASSVVNGVVSVRNELISINNDTVLRQMETDRLQNKSTIQIVSNVSSAIANNAPQVIQETAQGVSSFGFEVANQVLTGYNPVGLAISGANEALSSINNRERNVVESTCEAVASGIATYAGGQLGSVIATGLLVKTAIETNANVVGNIIQEEINRHQLGDI